MPTANIVYKTLGFKWLFEHSARKVARNPQRFIPPTVMGKVKGGTADRHENHRQFCLTHLDSYD